MENNLQLLIKVLLDKSAREDERGDAAIDLRTYKNPRALEALTEIASDPTENDVIVDNCAEAIGEICVVLDWFDETNFRKMTPFAQKIVIGFILAYQPNLIPKSLKNEFAFKRVKTPNKTILLNSNEVWPLVNILNECCHGINIYPFEKIIGFSRDKTKRLLDKILSFEEQESEPENGPEVEMNEEELQILDKCFKEVLKEIEEWEFSTRLGISIPEAKKIMENFSNP